MVGAIFMREVKDATGTSWEEWLVKLQQDIQPSWSHEQMKAHIRQHHNVTDEWGEWLALLYGQKLGRTPDGITKDAGVQIGIRRTVPMTKEQAWRFLTSPQGLSLWIGTVPSFQLQKGFEFTSAEGISGKLTVVVPFQKLRMTWKCQEWEQPSRLQIYMLHTNSGKTTIAFHQEMLEDVYMREIMKRYWQEKLSEIQKHAEAIG